jgi:hypothetical protein
MLLPRAVTALMSQSDSQMQVEEQGHERRGSMNSFLHLLKPSWLVNWVADLVPSHPQACKDDKQGRWQWSGVIAPGWC